MSNFDISFQESDRCPVTLFTCIVCLVWANPVATPSHSLPQVATSFLLSDKEDSFVMTKLSKL